MTRRSKKLRIAAVTVALLVIVAAMILPAFIRARTTSASNACVNNLRQLDGAKEQWKLENHKTTNDVCTWQDLLPYLIQEPVCPQGGAYILGRAGEPPRCSLGGLSHTMP